MARLASFIIIILVLLLVLFFTTLNGEPVTLDYYLGKVHPPLAVVIIVALVSGAVIGLIFSMIVITTSRYEVLKLRREIKQTEKELLNLRNLPIRDKH